MRAFHQELAHYAVHHRKGAILWCDGDHGFNPYDFAELNLERGHEADAGANRVLIKRCMTPFQWDTVLTKHLDQKLLEVETAMILAAPYEALFSTDELQDWEQEDYVAYSLRHLAELARRHHVPVVLSVDMANWWRTHPALARNTYDAVQDRWSIRWMEGGWRAARDGSDECIEASPRRYATLWDFVREEMPLPAMPRRARSAPRSHRGE